MKRVQLFFLPKELNPPNYGWSTYPNVTLRNKASGNFDIWLLEEVSWSLRIEINQSKRLRCLRCYSCSGCSIAVFSINSPSLSTLTGDRGNITKTWLKSTLKAATNGKQLFFLNAAGFQGTCSGRTSHIVAGGTIPSSTHNHWKYQPSRKRNQKSWVLSCKVEGCKIMDPQNNLKHFQWFLFAISF